VDRHLQLRVVNDAPFTFTDGVGAEGAGRQLRALQLRPRRERVAVRRPEPEPRVPDERPPGDRHHLRPAAAPAPGARDCPARRRRIGKMVTTTARLQTADPSSRQASKYIAPVRSLNGGAKALFPSKKFCKI